MRRSRRALGILWAVTGAIGGIHPTAIAQPLCGEWKPVEAPGGFQTIIGITAGSPVDAWGLTGSGHTIHWNGSAWGDVALPDLSGLGTSVDLRAVASLSSGSFFVAGIVQTSVWTTEQLLVTWDGSDWDRIETLELVPNISGAPRYGSPSAIAAAAPDDLWIIGLATGSGDGVSGSPILTLHWDGSALAEISTPGVGNRQNNMYDAVAIASDDMWAVGEYNNSGVGDLSFHGMTYHYDGSAWSPVPNPTQSIASTHLNAVAAIATDDVWAAGDSPAGPLFMHWNGSSWTIVPGPSGVQTGTIQALAAIATDDVWAVDSPWQVPLISKYYHWDGTTWSVVVPEVAGATSVIRSGGLAAAGECNVWAAGNINFGSGAEAFIEQLQGAVSPTAVPGISGSVASVSVLPNPVRESARIRFTIPGDVPERAHVYDVRGQRVRTLFDEPVRGSAVTWDGRDDAGARLAAGVYFLRAESRAGVALTKKLTLVR